MLLPDPRAGAVPAVGVTVVHPDEICRETAVVVDVGLFIRHPDRIPEFGELRLFAGGDERFEIAREQFVFGRIVICRGRNRHSVFGIGREAKSKIVGLHAPVAVAGHATVARLDERKQTAARIGRFQIGIHRHNELVLRRPGAYAVERFAVFGIRLAPDETGNARLCHQIAFVSRVDEHLRAKNFSAFSDDLNDACSFLFHCGQSLLKVNRRPRFVDHPEKNIFGDVRLEGPQGSLRPIQRAGCGLGAASSGEILVGCFTRPGGGLPVVCCDSLVEFPRDAADGRLVADVRRAEAARSQTAEVPSEFHDDGGLAHPPGLHRGSDARRGAAVNANVGFNHLG